MTTYDHDTYTENNYDPRSLVVRVPTTDTTTAVVAVAEYVRVSGYAGTITSTTTTDTETVVVVSRDERTETE